MTEGSLARAAAWAALLAAGPSLVAACFSFAGGASWLEWLGVTAAGFLAALAAVRAWEGDLAVLAEIARRGAWTTALPTVQRRLVLPGTRRTAEEIARLAGKLVERAALIESLLGAEEAIVERLPDPLVLLGADRNIRRANEAARTAFGREVAAVLRHPTLRAAIDAARPAGAAGAPVRADLRLALPVERDLHATVIALDPPLPGGGATLVVLSDRTRERAIEQTRSDFIANASHELRTPLTGLIGFIDTLRGPAADDPPAQARFLGIMAEQAARMNRLIDDLLSLSRIEISEHQAPQTPIAVDEVLERVVAGFEPRLRPRSQALELAAGADLPPVLADEDQIVQVLENLLDNACKYGRDQGRMRLAAERAEGGSGVVVPGVLITVADDGPGIARAHLPRLTERFYRVDPGRSRSGPTGTGLGLAIVKHIVNRHRGTLRIDSELGAGTTFRIWLPAARPPAEPGRTQSLAEPGRTQSLAEPGRTQSLAEPGRTQSLAEPGRTQSLGKTGRPQSPAD